jgi:hypothetical protein
MDKRERASVKITDFHGVAIAADAADLPPGASQHQVNVASRRVGQLQTRKGFLPVSFEQTTIISNLAGDS